MNADRVYLDTVFVQALLNSQDQYHELAMTLFPQFRDAGKWISEAGLIEVGDALCRRDRAAAARFIRRCYQTPEIRVVPMNTELLHEALALYESRSDKSWGMTDCISFVVMQANGLTAALTADKHFIQAGFRALLLEEA